MDARCAEGRPERRELEHQHTDGGFEQLRRLLADAAVTRCRQLRVGQQF